MEASLAAAVEAAVTPEALRAALLRAQDTRRRAPRCGALGGLPDRPPALELAARELRGLVAAAFLAAGLPEDAEPQPALADRGAAAPAAAEPAAAGPTADGPPAEGGGAPASAALALAPAPPVADAAAAAEPASGQPPPQPAPPAGAVGAPDSAQRGGASACLTASLQDYAAESPLPTRAVELQADGSRWAEARLACPRCRRPLDLQLRLEAAAGPGGAPALAPREPSPPGRREACCAVLGDGGKASFLQALALGQSLASAGSERERLLLHSPLVPGPYLAVLERFWTLRQMDHWPLVFSRASGHAKKEWKLFALQLTEYSKVLLLELGLVVRCNVDQLFGLECPAAVRRPEDRAPGGEQDEACAAPGWRWDTSVALLQPSSDALKRMAAEVGSECCAWPPRGADGGTHQSMLEDYLVRFFSTFFAGGWTEIPEEFTPVKLSEAAPALPTGLVFQVQQRSEWESLDRRLRDYSGSGAAGGALVQLLEQAEEVVAECPGPGLLEQLGRVERRRCSQCRSHDARGTQDPLDRKWRCRFCWEELLLDAARRERFAMPLPLPAAEAEELRRELGACYVEGAGRQRWAWSAGGPPGWIEFRPRGVLWTKDDGVGAWEPLREWDRGTFLAVHICDRVEVRYVLRLRGAPDAAGCLELEEWQREVSRPLGFCRRSPERRAWCRSHASVPRSAPDRAGEEPGAVPAAEAAGDPQAEQAAGGAGGLLEGGAGAAERGAAGGGGAAAAAAAAAPPGDQQGSPAAAEPPAQRAAAEPPVARAGGDAGGASGTAPAAAAARQPARGKLSYLL